MEWQPIETAPRDGTTFQAWIVNIVGAGFWVSGCRYNDDGAFEIYGRVDYDMYDWAVYSHLTPTHWMPLPEPPRK